MTTILVVDDHVNNRTKLKTLLINHNYNVLESANGMSAFEIIKKNHPDLIICEIIISGLNGYELANKIHRNPNLADIPIIFYTATHHLEDATLIAMKCNVKFVVASSNDP